MKRQRGFALVLTLIVTALLTALVVEFVREVYVDTSHSHNFVASQQAGMLAASGAKVGMKILQYDLPSHSGYTSLLDFWAKPISYDAEVGTVTIVIEEESGKLDLNSATAQAGDPDPADFFQNAAKRLLTRLELSQELYQALWDWADTNDSPLPGGGETSYYASQKPAIMAKNNRLDTVEELGLIRGFTPEVIEKLRSCVTVYGRAPGQPAAQININTAPKEVLAALDDKLMNDGAVQDILDYRKTKAIKDISEVPRLDAAVATGLRGKISYAGKIFRIHSEAKVGESVSVVEAVVEVSPKLSVLYWREY